MITRTALAIVAALALALAGCAYNPGYFPYLLPGGHIKQEHAKPRGHGYFKNFDPKACKLEVTPGPMITAPVGSQVVLVGTVFDNDGQPRRSRRVEWMVDGPGNIVEADESGIYPGRGYKVDNKYAVSHTSYITKTITRGNDDPGDDVIIEPGRTFCVLSSAVPGETVVTAYAPEVFNWDQGRTVVRICWGDGRFNFPAPAVVRYGGEHTLTTTVTAGAGEDEPNGYRIRYKVLDGPPAVLVSHDGNTSLTGATREAEATTDVNGAAAVRLVQQDPKPGKTRVAVEIVKSPENGVGAGTVVARRETVVEWAAPQIGLTVSAPPAAGAGGTYPVTVMLDNAGGVDSKDARVKVTLTDGATLANSEPPPSRQEAGGVLIFDLPPVVGKGKQEVTLQVKPARLGTVTVTAEAATTDGLQATSKATTRIETGKLHLVVEAPPMALVGEPIPFRVAVTNASAAPAEHVIVWAQFDAGLSHSSPQNPVELSAGTVAAGQTKVIDLPLTAKKSGRYGVRANATGDGNLAVRAEDVSVNVRRAEIAVAAVGPKLAYVNQEFAWTVTIRNNGDAPVSNVLVRATLPSEVRAKAADDGGQVAAGSVEWKLSELRPGDDKTLKVTAEGLRLVDRATMTVAVLGDATTGVRSVGDVIEAKAESTVAIIGTPAVVLELVTPPGVLEVGKRAAFKVRVRNDGTVSARNIEVTAFAPPELRPSRGSGPVDGRVDATGKITFPAVDELRPGEALTFTIDVEALQAGDARFRAEVKAAHLKKPLQEEQAARITVR
jgi:uncharacterized repeat protein (TIGR01451 family)